MTETTVEVASFQFSSLPSDLRLYVFTFLKAEDLAIAVRVSKEWQNLTSKPKLWRNLWENDISQWKAFQNIVPPPSKVPTTGETVMKYASSLLEYFWRPAVEVKPNNKEDNEEEDLTPNVNWKELYLQQHLANHPKYQAQIKTNTSKTRKIHRIPMIGEGVENKGSAKRLLYNIMWSNNQPLGAVTAMYPGTEGVGSGVGFTLGGFNLNLIAVNKYEDRKVFEQARPTWANLFKASNGFIFVVNKADDLDKAKSEIHNFVTDGWISQMAPILVLSVTDEKEEDTRKPGYIAENLGLNEMKSRNWFIHTVNENSLEGLLESFLWLTSHLI